LSSQQRSVYIEARTGEEVNLLSKRDRERELGKEQTRRRAESQTPNDCKFFSDMLANRAIFIGVFALHIFWSACAGTPTRQIPSF